MSDDHKPDAFGPQFPISFTVAKRPYEAIEYRKTEEPGMSGSEMLERAKELRAVADEIDCGLIRQQQQQLPAELRLNYLVFAGWRHPDSRFSAVLVWDPRRKLWYQTWTYLLLPDWNTRSRLVRPVRQNQLQPKPKEVP